MLEQLRQNIHDHTLIAQQELIEGLVKSPGLNEAQRDAVSQQASALVDELRQAGKPLFLQSFLTEYGLSNQEGVALMCLAEAYLRVPDSATLDELIAEKIVASSWQQHVGKASSLMVNASTWALMLTGRLLSVQEDRNLLGSLRSTVRRLGEPVVRLAMTEVMQQLGNHFVLGENIGQAVSRGRELESKSYTFSYDMLGESARTEADAQRYCDSYAEAIVAIAARATGDVRLNPGISVKLSALHPRVELRKKPLMFAALLERSLNLAKLAAQSNLSFNIDAEEADRLELTLDIIAALAGDKSLQGWDGLGVVVQSYSRRTLPILAWLKELAIQSGRRFMVRLVKGAYWDTEIKRAQVNGLSSYPVFTRKCYTDVSYIAASKQLLLNNDRLYPQFSTHNAHTLAAVLKLAGVVGTSDFELQRLYGMGESLHELVRQKWNSRHRIYAPVGEHRDLLAYLVRRLLENGANSSFVHQLTDKSIPVSRLVADPYKSLVEDENKARLTLPEPQELFFPRINSSGWDLANPSVLKQLDKLRQPWRDHFWSAGPLVVQTHDALNSEICINPANATDKLGQVAIADEELVVWAIATARAHLPVWQNTSVASRAGVLCKAADLLQARFGEVLALLTREAGKTLADSIAEWREAIDLLRYYAQQATTIEISSRPRGVCVCISPWNFPLAIFSGQIAAALVTGNVVLAKPAEQTPLLAFRMIQLMHEAGVPAAALQLLTGDGAGVGASLCAATEVNMVCFTGSLDTAQRINRSMAEHLPVEATLIAETGGINAMIVDSSALPEQTVNDIITSAFLSAGQRCSALRMLYLQQEVADDILTMLLGAIKNLTLDDPWHWHSDIGPVIDSEAASDIQQYLESVICLNKESVKIQGNFISPALIDVSGIADIPREVFGPVLHVAKFDLEDLPTVIQDINASGYGLTFAVHSRLQERIETCSSEIAVGNVYVNRNQVGAVVGSQPFGGQGLSGTGPKAGGPHYLSRLVKYDYSCNQTHQPEVIGPRHGASIAVADLDSAMVSLEQFTWPAWQNRLAELQALFTDSIALKLIKQIPIQQTLPGPTGEDNHLQLVPRGLVLCLGPSADQALQQALQALAFGNKVIICCNGGAAFRTSIEQLGELLFPVTYVEGVAALSLFADLNPLDLVALHSLDERAVEIRRSLSGRSGSIVPLITELIDPLRYCSEKHICTDTTAAGGNIDLMTDLIS